jgi:hypothetical protein
METALPLGGQFSRAVDTSIDLMASIDSMARALRI